MYRFKKALYLIGITGSIDRFRAMWGIGFGVIYLTIGLFLNSSPVALVMASIMCFYGGMGVHGILEREKNK